MSEILDRDPGESVAEFAQRMIDLIGLIVGTVQSEADMLIDADDFLEDLRFVVEHVGDDDWDECWQLRLGIKRVISRMSSATRLNRILYFAQEMSR